MSTLSQSAQAEKIKNLRHDLKNDISVIIAFTQLVKLNPQDPKTDEFLSKVEDRAKHILDTVEKYFTKEVLLESINDKQKS